MKVTDYSRFRLMQTAVKWNVDREYFEPIYNYLIYGYSPGGFFTSVLANDWAGAIQRSHPGNTVDALKRVTGWIRDVIPAAAVNSYEAVNTWCALSAEDRRSQLEQQGLIYTEQQEVELALRGTAATEPWMP